MVARQRLRVLPGPDQRLLEEILRALPVPVGEAQEEAEERLAVFALEVGDGSFVGVLLEGGSGGSHR
ncbi:hypothetical protein GCM10009730_00490 [Streptomyces albidochromogenes]